MQSYCPSRAVQCTIILLPNQGCECMPTCPTLELLDLPISRTLRAEKALSVSIYITFSPLHAVTAASCKQSYTVKNFMPAHQPSLWRMQAWSCVLSGKFHPLDLALLAMSCKPVHMKAQRKHILMLCIWEHACLSLSCGWATGNFSHLALPYPTQKQLIYAVHNVLLSNIQTKCTSDHCFRCKQRWWASQFREAEYTYTPIAVQRHYLLHPVVRILDLVTTTS